MTRMTKVSAALLLGAMVALGSVGSTMAMSGSAASVRSVGQAAALPKIEVRGGIRYHELQTARDGLNDPRDLGVWQAEADRYGVERRDPSKGYF